MKAVTAQIIRELDRRAIEEYGISGSVLMENAGGGTARILLDRFPEVYRRGATIVAGTGNNGGDGFVIARHLANRGVEADVFLVGDETKVRAGESANNLAVLKKMGVAVVPVGRDEDVAALVESVRTRGIVVDALFGTGLEREVTGIFARVVAVMNEGRPILAVDVPSGISSDTGRVLGCAVKADVTVTFALPKVGSLIYPAADYVGELVVLDISIPAKLVEASPIRDYVLEPGDFAPITAGRHADSHKGDFGHLLIVAGSRGKSGAAVLCGTGALLAGAGLVTIGAPQSQLDNIAVRLTEAMTEPLPDDVGALGRSAFERIEAVTLGKSAVALGPGLGTGAGAVAAVRRLIEKVALPLVIDADGINAIATDTTILKRKKGSIILTPHPGEMGRLVGKSAGEVQEDRIGISRRFAADFGIYVVLKGARTIIAEPSGDVYISMGGNPGMASGGMGDVLNGARRGLPGGLG